jgi:phosphatidylinositol alpha-1,6-mannosyltransferase
MVCQALADRNALLVVVALHDAADVRGDGHWTLAALDYHACHGRRSTFIRQALLALRRRPSLVLVEHPNFSPLGWFCARLTGARLVVFAHGTDIWTPLPAIRRWALRRADRIVCVSALTAARAVQANGLTPQKVIVVHNCLDPQFAAGPTVPSSGAGPSLLTVARISASDRYKGHDQVIRALPTLLTEFPTLVYEIVGDGDGRPALEALAREQGVAHAVHFRGVVSEEALAAYYAGSSVYVMPSRGEGFGLAFAEAMAYGKPVIAGNEDASAEIVRDGETGILVNPTETSELINAIARLLRNDELRQMGARGAEVVNREFRFSAFRTKLIDLLQDSTPSPPLDYEDASERTRL